MSSTEENSKWKELEKEIEAEGFKRSAYQKNALGGSNEISGMSFRRDNLYINLKRMKDEKGNLTDKFEVELYNSDTGTTEEQKGLTQDLAWNMAKVAAEAGTSFGERGPNIPEQIHVQVSTNTPNIKKSFFEYLKDPNDKGFGIFVHDVQREKKEPSRAFNLLLFPVASMSFDEADKFLKQGEYKVPEDSPFKEYRGKTFYWNYPGDVGLPSYWNEIKNRVRELEAEKEQTTLGGLKPVHTGYAPVTKRKEAVPKTEIFPSTLDFFTRPKEQKKLDEGSEGEAHEFELYWPFMNTKEIVGRSTWTLLHNIGANLHDPPTTEEQKAVVTVIKELSSIYPCLECRPGFSYVDENPIDFSSRSSVEQWLCLPPDQSIICKEGYKQISQITVGDLVLTHKGRFREVTQVFSRPFSENLKTISVYGYPSPLKTTPEHPILNLTTTVTFSKGKRVTLLSSEQWTEASSIDESQVLLLPRESQEGHKTL